MVDTAPGLPGKDALPIVDPPSPRPAQGHVQTLHQPMAAPNVQDLPARHKTVAFRLVQLMAIGDSGLLLAHAQCHVVPDLKLVHENVTTLLHQMVVNNVLEVAPKVPRVTLNLAQLMECGVNGLLLAHAQSPVVLELKIVHDNVTILPLHMAVNNVLGVAPKMPHVTLNHAQWTANGDHGALLLHAQKLAEQALSHVPVNVTILHQPMAVKTVLEVEVKALTATKERAQSMEDGAHM